MSQLIDPSIARQFDKLPPHDIGAEMCVLASMMLDRVILGEVVTIVGREDFYQADHQIIFDAVVRLYSEGRDIDATLVRAELAKRQLLEEVGGVDYLIQLMNAVPSAVHGAGYAKVVREKAILRQLISASNDMLREC